jgi:hypothetical protein
MTIKKRLFILFIINKNNEKQNTMNQQFFCYLNKILLHLVSLQYNKPI